MAVDHPWVIHPPRPVAGAEISDRELIVCPC